VLSKIENILNPGKYLENKAVRIALVYLVAVLYVAGLAYFLIKDKYHLVAIPIGLLILALAIYRMQWLYWLVLFSVPLSFPLKELAPSLGFNMFLPTEPLLAGLLVVFILKLVVDKGFDRAILSHPITQIILLQLLWLFITALTSTMVAVSFKFFLSRLWFVTIFYFIATQLFKNPQNIRKYLWVYLFPLGLMIIKITLKHAGLGLFDQKASNPAVDPFFNDHTLYGAIMAMMIPVAFGYLVRSNFNWWQRIVALLVLALLFTGLLFSYSRAAWVSLLGGIGIYLILLFKIKGRTVLLATGALVVLFLLFGKTLLMQMERNDQDSSDNLTEHVQSISNITTDASNLERLNRWSCALRMWVDKPVFGFGPGTYMFQYAPYQKESQKTIISTNAADGGNAHSEFLGPLSESGILGALFMLILVFYALKTGIKVYKTEKQPEYKMVAIALTIGLVTYFLHGIMNNFLDTDKASALVWGSLGVLVALDVAQTRQSKAE